MSELLKSGRGNIEPDHQRLRSFCATSFRTDPPIWDPKKMSYLCYAPEICPSTGRNHWQVYVHWIDNRTLTSCSKNLDKITCLVAKGTAEQNRTYIKGPYTEGDKHKPENPLFKEYGKLPEQGKRNDLDKIKDEIIAGRKVDEIAIEQPTIYHQYGRTLNKIEDIAMRRKFRTEMTTCIWYYGSTGVGKSHKAFENYHPDTHYVLPNDNGWWDAYTQQDTVIINDFRGWIPYDRLLQLIDQWPETVNRRGREPMPFISKNIIITSSLAPEEVYCHRMENDKIEQLLRRICVVKLESATTSSL